MKLFRYLTREVCTLFIAITLILMVIFLSHEWFRYLSRVVAGRLSMTTMLELLLLSLPQLLGLLLPLGFFFALLVAKGRLYADSEMTAMFAGGLSPYKLGLFSLLMAIVIALISGTISLSIAPRVAKARQELLRRGGMALMVDLLLPGQFQAFGKRVIFVESIDDKLHGIFVAKQEPGMLDIMTAAHGEILETDTRALVLYDGQRYQGPADSYEFNVTAFSQLKIPITKTTKPISMNVKSLPTSTLWQHYHENPAYIAELQWRFSVPLMAFILALISVPLARVSPRQGRYAKILPAILIIVVYANLLFFIRGWIKSGEFPVGIGLWGLHGVFLFLALILWRFDSLKRLLRLA